MLKVKKMNNGKKYTQVRLTRSVWLRLKQYGRKGETFSDIINRLLDEVLKVRQ